MSNVETFFDKIILDKNNDARDEMDSILKQRIMQTIEDKKKEVANNLFNGEAEQDE